MDVADVKDVVVDFFSSLNEKVTDFFTFVAGKLQNFKNLSVGEQISYCCVGAGILLVVVAVFMFLLM